MADNMVEDEFQWLSAELRILEAEYEKSKLRVFQDTLLCKRSMMELELLCKNEQIRKNARANNKIKKHEYQLQEQLESLSTELKNATNQLQTAQNTLQDEKVHHDMEKKKLEDKLNSEMEKKIEKQRESAIHKENLLQEEIKSWQEKHVKTIKEAEDLRMELSKKNVPVKTKAIQTRVTVEDASTMAQVDLQTCDVGVQVQALSSEDEGFRKADEDVSKNDKGVRKADEDVRKPYEVLQGMDDTVKGRKRVAKAKGKNHIKTIVKDGKSERNKDRNDKRNVKGKRANQSKENENERSDKKRQKESPKAERKMKSRSTKQEGDLSANDAMAEHHNEELHGRAKASNAWLVSSVTQENDVPLRYSKTPRRLRKKSDESNQSLEKSCTDKSDMSTCMAEEITASMAEASTSEKHNEDNENKRAVKSNEVKLCKEDVHDDKNGAGKKASQQQTVEKQQNRVVTEVSLNRGLNECQKRLEEKELSVSERENAFEEVQEQDKNSKSVQNKKEIKQKQENKKTKKTKEEKVLENKSEDEGDQNKGGRVLRKRTKKPSSGVEMDPCKGQSEDSRKQTHDNHEKATTKKYKTDDICLKGHDSAMLHTSSPEVHQLPRESELSAREIDPLVDEPRPSQGVTSRATADDTSQQPETDVQEELNGGNNKAAKGERLGDYNSGRGSSDLNYNRIKEVGEKIDLHKALEEGKSSRGEDSAKKANTEGKNNKKIDLASAKCRKRKQTGQKLEDIDNTCVSKRQDLDAVDPDNNACSTKRKAKATFPDAGHSKRKGSQHPAELSVTGCEKTATKENTQNAKTGGKKRKPTSRVRKVLAPADQQSCSDATTSTEISSMLDVTKKRKTLFNSRENSLMVPNAKVQISFANTTLSKSRTGAGIPPSLSAFMRSFIAPKLKKPQ